MAFNWDTRQEEDDTDLDYLGFCLAHNTTGSDIVEGGWSYACSKS